MLDRLKRRWPEHDSFVRSLRCILADKPGHICNSPVRACHFRTAANSGTGLKPPSWELWPGCDLAHVGEQHRLGQREFERRYSVDLHDIAVTCVHISTDQAMREYMKERGFL